MSYDSIGAIWTQLEKRADLTTTLRDTVGQYAMQTALCGRNNSSPESIQAFDRLINMVRITFHLQRIYLQPRQPSQSIEHFLIEPSFIIEILIFLLTIKDDCVADHQDLSLHEGKTLRSIGAVLLAGLRLLALYKSKVVLPLSIDWASSADLLKDKLANWPLRNIVHRTLVGELCMRFLEELSISGEVPLMGSFENLCEHHKVHSGALDDVDLPDFNDGLVGFHPTDYEP